jgi:hypothetical protein
LIAENQSQRWEVLFDGTSTSAWRELGSSEFPGDVWIVEEGCLTLLPNLSDGKDLITLKQYRDFEFKFEWKISEGGNSGIKYLVREDKYNPDRTRLRNLALLLVVCCTLSGSILFLVGFKARGRRWLLTLAGFLVALDLLGIYGLFRFSRPTGNAVGLEFQLYDDWKLRSTDKNYSSGALYDLIAPSENVVNPAGVFNTGRIVVNGHRVEHWINGTRILEYELDSLLLKERIAQSKFKRNRIFGRKSSGHISLQNHGDAVWFRNLRIRPIQESPDFL